MGTIRICTPNWGGFNICLLLIHWWIILKTDSITQLIQDLFAIISDAFHSLHLFWFISKNTDGGVDPSLFCPSPFPRSMYSTLRQTCCSSLSRMLSRGYWSSVTCIQVAALPAERSLGRSCHTSMRALCHLVTASHVVDDRDRYETSHSSHNIWPLTCRQSRWVSSAYFIKQSLDLLRTSLLGCAWEV